jgi:hypothetical protein
MSAAFTRIMFMSQTDGNEDHMTIKSEEETLQAIKEMHERLSSAIVALTPDKEGRYKLKPAIALESLRDHSGLELDANTYEWARQAQARNPLNWLAISVENNDVAQKDWLQSRCREAEVIKAQIQKCPALADTFRTVKLAARRPELTAAYHDLLRHVNLEELRAMLKRSPPNKTGGPSGLTREHFLHLPDEILRCFVPFVNELLDGKAPMAIKLGIIVPMVKDAQRYRPITLLETPLQSHHHTCIRPLLCHGGRIQHPRTQSICIQDGRYHRCAD